ncbi:YfmQ family protein [Bacillus sp. z60-18]|uniref:YfmQ family protein n=1 Tax=unclassified Bacillus (in: firmicutes) TaxID=185979 RepID=UPI00390C8894
MTWVFVMLLVFISLFKILVTCLPTGVVEWMTSKFQVHSKLDAAGCAVTIGGRRLKGQDHKQFIEDFNQAIFMERYYIYPGDEHLYLNPKNGGSPFVIDAKKGKHDVRLFVYRYDDHIDVVKQSKKKTAAYRLRSESLQNCTLETAKLV